MARDSLPYSVEETVDSTRHRSRSSETGPKFLKGRPKCAHPPDLDVMIDLGPERTVLGRLPDDTSSPPINHPTVSRAHFQIEWDPSLGVHMGRDTGSRNGSWVDGEKANKNWHALSQGT